MGGLQRRAHRLTCLALVFSACGIEPVGTEDDCQDILPGDLVITEVQANPRGADGDREYIEIYNASGSVILLDGVTLMASRIDGTSPKTHRMGAIIQVDPGDYLVAANAASEPLPAHVDYAYGGALGSLRNTEGSVSLWCGTQLIDSMQYERSTDGRALELDGRLAPDHERNDEVDGWCLASQEVGALPSGDFGTPGGPNGSCHTPSAEGTCLAEGVARPIVSPEPGEVRIVEWMANPAGPDPDLEWVEVAFEADADLNGFQLGPAPDALAGVIDDEGCVPVGAGERVVFGASPAAAPRVDAELRFSLGNSGDRSIVAGSGGSVLDRVDYQQTSEGVAWQVDADAEVCLALQAEEYLAGNRGTPAEANPACPLALTPEQCLEQGTLRDIARPVPGQVRIVEWMADPAAVGNREGEWVELRVEAPVDLNGLSLSDRASSTTAIQSDACLRVAAGTHFLLARSVDPAKNGGIEGVGAELSLSLNNSDEMLTLSSDGQAIDSVSYAQSKPGVATQVDELGQICDAVHAYGEGDLGTPGAANPSCF